VTLARTFSEALRDRRIQKLLTAAGLPGHYIDDLAEHVVPLAAALCRQARDRASPLLVGLNGCQGSGKSTLAEFLSLMLQIGARVHCPVLSIDDFYLKKSVRRRLARDVHPLLVTRGAPGTHDLTLADKTLTALLDRSRPEPARVPGFDKATDERLHPEHWRAIAPGVDVVVLEGWCVGCPPQPAAALREPVNELERNEDTDGKWRSYVNEQLEKDYRIFFERLDLLVMLKAPGFECVYEWRREQERQLQASLGEASESASQILDGPALRRFIDHFERLTRHQLATLPAKADAVVELSAAHRMVGHSGCLYP